MQKTRTVTIYEVDYSGHRMNYVALIGEAFYNTGWNVVVATTTDAINSVEYKELLGPYADRFKIVTVPRIPASRSILSDMVRRSLALLRFTRTRKMDLLFIPVLDPVFYVFGLLFSDRLLGSQRLPSIRGILFRGNYAYKEVERTMLLRAKQKLAELVISKGPYTRVLCPDEIVYNNFRNRFKSGPGDVQNRFVLCPDPVETSYDGDRTNSFRKAYGIPRDAKVLAGFGNIDVRKGMDLLIDAFLGYKPSPNEFLLLIGKHSTEVRDLLNRLSDSETRRNNIVSIDRFVSNEELFSAIHTSDVVAATYPMHTGSASVVIRAAAFNKPVLASGNGWVGYCVRKYDLGHCCNVLDQVELVDGIRWAFKEARSSSDGARKLASLNSVQRFQETVVKEAERQCF
jgi:glycosyltransferase involved in cell wall biosynthesis